MENQMVNTFASSWSFATFIITLLNLIGIIGIGFLVFRYLKTRG